MPPNKRMGVKSLNKVTDKPTVRKSVVNTMAFPAVFVAVATACAAVLPFAFALEH